MEKKRKYRALLQLSAQKTILSFLVLQAAFIFFLPAVNAGISL